MNYSGTGTFGRRCPTVAFLGVLAILSLNSSGLVSAAAPPLIDSIDPVSGPIAGGTDVLINGTNFVDGATVWFDYVDATDVLVSADGTMISCTTPAGTAGAVDVVVTNPDTQDATLTGGFIYYDPALYPLIDSIDPVVGPEAGGTLVTITGFDFVDGATVTFDGVDSTDVTFISDTEIICTTPAGIATVDVVVTNPDTQSNTLVGGFTFVAPPLITDIDPVSGPEAGGTPVTIFGIDFVDGATVTFDGTDATDVVFVSDMEISCTTPAGIAATVDVVVANPDTQSNTLVGGFIYYDPALAPLLTSIDPVSGPNAGGTLITLTGFDFVDGATVTFGGIPTPIAPSFVSATTLICTAPVHAAGVVDVVVTNPDTQSDTLVGGFTFITPPSITSALTATVTIGSQFSYTITAIGSGPFTFSASPLPEGLVLSGSTISGIPTEIGTFTVNLTVSNGAGTDTKVLVIQVNAITPSPDRGSSQSNIDSDGDGFLDEIETVLGSSPMKATSTPFGWPAAGAPVALSPKLTVALNFAKGGSDSIQVSGVLPVRAGFVAPSQPVVVDVGGVVKTFTLDLKGNGTGATNARFKLQFKAKQGVVLAQNAKFSAKLGKADFASLLGDEGLSNADLKDASRTVPVIILFDQTVFRTDVTVLYTAKLNKTGRTKQPR